LAEVLERGRYHGRKFFGSAEIAIGDRFRHTSTNKAEDLLAVPLELIPIILTDGFFTTSRSDLPVAMPPSGA
jgi:hypothetical protein